MLSENGGISGLRTPPIILDIGITGHRSRHPIFSHNRMAISESLSRLIDLLERVAHETLNDSDEGSLPLVRLHSMLAYGADIMAVDAARAKGWPVVAPLPFGRALNLAINAHPTNLADMQALLEGHAAADPDTALRAAEIETIAKQVSLFELAEQDKDVEAYYRAHLGAPDDRLAEQAFVGICSDRAAMAARVMVEHSDILVGIWDGVTRGTVGGTRHTIESALEQGITVIWIDAANPYGWHILRATEELAGLTRRAPDPNPESAIRAIVRETLCPVGDKWQNEPANRKWRAKSTALFQAYRRVEAVFGTPGARAFRSLTQYYEHPDAIAAGSGAPMLKAAKSLPGGDPVIAERIATDILQPFAWADGVSTWLSDAYRGGMVASFLLSAFAIIGGIAYLPFASIDAKWGFAAFEFLVLAAIVLIFLTGKRRHWHERWFETRRVAEYFRHAPILLLLGAARSTGRWPRGSKGNWPEWHVRHAMRGVGLPHMKVTSEFLRAALVLMRDHHVLPQRSYHQGKSIRLKRTQHNLHRTSELLFLLAVLSVTVYLLIEIGAAMQVLPHDLPHAVAKSFTFLGVLFPTLGGAFAGIHYFGDFERFAAISEITAEKLGDVETRIAFLLDAPDCDIAYSRVSGLAHAIDDIVVDEIENWQAVFGGKHITVPV
ncbi:hypothetical protein EUU23_13785 [Sphingorhabdus sp. IMCC26285]|jgi:hypothetical protein|uniref:SMODS and SLOG-associating 2TM effector domain-containing protein n=1 Tax=Sphingorhabdus profundilacus TaxID=2509718 RepID=A0A6I4M0P8_9SPHN|nr:hypothetical protein [Sphingorhabdus profundilacus]MVZ98759.1 hypothetical protein [Sphingorhabdus profundilacus]